MLNLKNYFLATRPQFLPASVLPVALGASVAWRSHHAFSPGLFIISLAAAVLYHSGMNVLNDYFDFRNGTDNINRGALTPFTGGSRFIQKGIISAGETLALGLALVALGSAFGLYLALKANTLILFIGAFGLLTGFFYSAPPVFLAGRGLGELTVGLNFGLLSVLGSYLVQAGPSGGISAAAVFSSLPLSFLIAALLYINEFPDYEADRLSGKKNLVVRLGPERGRWGIIFLAVGAYLGLAAGVWLGYLPRLSLIALLSGLFALSSASSLLKNFNRGPLLIPSIKSMILAHLSSGVLLVISNLL